MFTASFCPSGLVRPLPPSPNRRPAPQPPTPPPSRARQVHLLHANMLLLLVVQGLEASHGRWQLLGLYAAGGVEEHRRGSEDWKLFAFMSCFGLLCCLLPAFSWP